MPVAEAVVKSEDDETIYDFINKSIPYHKRKAIVTDSKKSYDDIMRKLGFKYHQHCVFHLLQRINKLINNEVNNYKKEFKAELKKTNPNYSDSKVKKLTKKAGKNIENNLKYIMMKSNQYLIVKNMKRQYLPLKVFGRK